MSAHRRAERIVTLRALLDQGHTLTSAAAEMGVARCTLSLDAKAAGLASRPEAKIAARRQGMQGNLGRTTEKHARVLARMEALRGKMSVAEIASLMLVSQSTAYAIWAKAHPGEPYEAIRAPAPAPETRGARGGLQATNRKLRDEALALQSRKRQMAALPRVTDSEAASLVAKFLAANTVTICRAVAVLPVNNNHGL